jgi:hypothetical protein
MSEDLLESIARGACRLAAPLATECYEDAEEMNEGAQVIHQTLDIDKTYDTVEGVGTYVDTALRPFRTARTIWRALRRR